jgi:hypothetical protein
MMTALFASGHIADVILGILVLEALAFAAYRRITGRGFRLFELLPNMLAGGCLVLALRTALVMADWTWTALALAAAFVAHIWDVVSRR